MIEDYYVEVNFHAHKPFAPEKMQDILEDLDDYGAAGGVMPDGTEGSISLTVEATDKDDAKAEARRVVSGAVTHRAPEGTIVTTEVEGVRTEEEMVEYLGEGADWFDPIEHPAHYNAYPVEVIELTEHMNFNRGNVIKYVARAGLKSKDTELEDLEKGLWYIQREIDRITR